MSEKKSAASGGTGVGINGALGLLFLALKLTGHIDWPWIWVLSPFWIPLAILVGAVVIVSLVMFTAGLIEAAGK